MFSYSIILGLMLEPGARFLRIFSTSNGPSRVANPVNVSLDGALGEKYLTSLTFLGRGGKTSTNGAPDKPCGKSVRMLTQNCR